MWAVGLALPLAAVSACNKAAPHAPPPPEVSVLTVEPRTVPAQYEFVGQAEASKHIEVRAQVSGVIVARPYVEGTDVRKGAVLFRIDPTTYEAAYRSAQAQLANAKATLANAERNLARLRPLLADHAVAQRDVDDAETAAEQARAGVQSAEAAVDRAKKDLDNSVVRAEVNGRVGRALMELGALVSGPSDLLTTIDQVDPIYVNFSPSDQELLRWRRDIAAKRIRFPSGPLPVRALLSDGSRLPHLGKVNFVDVSLQPVTGTLQLRAEFPNPGHALLPGQFVRVQLMGVQRTGAILVPQRAVQQGLNGAYVYVLDDSGKVASRTVVASSWDGGWWIIDAGLSAGDRVIVDGTQKVMPGQVARATVYQPSADTTLTTRMDSIPVAPGAGPLTGAQR
ncbi:MAG: efflux RND transporter periplasmic adaptor subunit [Gemmatimonadaceae bacterium]|nr:efflux RND transporter periplasmic adaptor subunit [Gemmatimonadaceae bacterium]